MPPLVYSIHYTNSAEHSNALTKSRLPLHTNKAPILFIMLITFPHFDIFASDAQRLSNSDPCMRKENNEVVEFLTGKFLVWLAAQLDSCRAYLEQLPIILR